jgi:hypothetical protein
LRFHILHSGKSTLLASARALTMTKSLQDHSFYPGTLGAALCRRLAASAAAAFWASLRSNLRSGLRTIQAFRPDDPQQGHLQMADLFKKVSGQ